jgi:hypothetical protein
LVLQPYSERLEKLAYVAERVRGSLQDRKTVSSEVLDLLIPAGGGEGRWVTPRVVVESEEIAALIIGTTVHVLSHLLTVRVDISSRVSDGDGTVSTASDVLSHVTSDSLDIWRSWGGEIIINNLVTGEESQGVGVVCEGIDGGEDVLEVNGVVGWVGIGSIEGVEGSVDIEDQVDTCSCQLGHAIIVVGRVVDCVDTDGVDAQLLELYDITLAGCGIGDRVNQVRGATGLVVHTTHVESAVAIEES